MGHLGADELMKMTVAEVSGRKTRYRVRDEVGSSRDRGLALGGRARQAALDLEDLGQAD